MGRRTPPTLPAFPPSCSPTAARPPATQARTPAGSLHAYLDEHPVFDEPGELEDEVAVEAGDLERDAHALALAREHAEARVGAAVGDGVGDVGAAREAGAVDAV